jgi:hypothetical protein
MLYTTLTSVGLTLTLNVIGMLYAERNIRANGLYICIYTLIYSIGAGMAQSV